MTADAFGLVVVMLAAVIGVGCGIADNRARLRRELAAGIDRRDWRMEIRHNGPWMVNQKRGEVLTLLEYEARIESTAGEADQA